MAQGVEQKLDSGRSNGRFTGRILRCRGKLLRRRAKIGGPKVQFFAFTGVQLSMTAASFAPNKPESALEWMDSGKLDPSPAWPFPCICLPGSNEGSRPGHAATHPARQYATGDAHRAARRANPRGRPQGANRQGRAAALVAQSRRPAWYFSQHG